MPAYMVAPKPKIVVTHSGAANDVSNYLVDAEVTRRENGIDIATVTLADTQSILYPDKVDEDDTIVISIKDESDAAYTVLLDGINVAALPSLINADLLMLKCDGAGYPLMRMVCGEQYGTESKNVTLDKLKEILTDATNGVVPAWVNKLGIDAGVSGYSVTTEVEDIAGSIRYLYFPYQPSHKTVSDVCEVVQAIKGANAGPHWMVTTGGKLLVSTIGAHHAAAVTEGWTNYYGGSQAAATFVQGVDFVEFYSQKLAKEANYILYAGRMRKPGGGDLWTEYRGAGADTGSALWNDDIQGLTFTTTLTNENGAGLFRIGSYSIEGHGDTVGDQFWFDYPTSRDSAWDLDKMGGEHNIPSFSFYIQRDTNVSVAADNELQVLLYRYNAGPPIFLDAYVAYLGLSVPTANKWYHFSFPIGSYWRSAQKDFDWIEQNSPSWSDIDGVNFQCLSNAAVQGKVYVDGLQFNGWALRGARQAVYSANDPCKMKVVTDDEAKDDTLVASDDSGTIARLAYAELLRSKTTPVIGKFTIPMLKDLWPGMLVYLNAKKKADGTFNIDSDFRVTKLIHHVTADPKGCTTTVHVTDDVKNAIARPAYNDLNKVLQAARPEFQDRQAASLKMRDIDITQAVLEKNY